MIRLDRILCPADFSPYSFRAADYAVALAQHYQGEVHFLHAVPRPLLPNLYPYLPEPVPPSRSRNPGAGAGSAGRIRRALPGRRSADPPERRRRRPRLVHPGNRRLRMLEPHLSRYSWPVRPRPAGARLRDGEGDSQGDLSGPHRFRAKGRGAAGGGAVRENRVRGRLLDAVVEGDRVYSLSLARHVCGRLTLFHALEWVPEERGSVPAGFFRDYRVRMEEESRDRLERIVPGEAKRSLLV